MEQAFVEARNDCGPRLYLLALHRQDDDVFPEGERLDWFDCRISGHKGANGHASTGPRFHVDQALVGVRDHLWRMDNFWMKRNAVCWETTLTDKRGEVPHDALHVAVECRLPRSPLPILGPDIRILDYAGSPLNAAFLDALKTALNKRGRSYEIVRE